MRRLLVPAGLVVLAVALGLVFFTPPARPAGSPLAASVLAASTSTNTTAQLAEGKTLFENTCSSCHGASAQGSDVAPSLRGVGAAAVDLWVSSGWMPLAVPTPQAIKKPVRFARPQTLAVAAFVASLTPGIGLPVPTVDLNGANRSDGFSIFALNCAPCHTITGAGDALSDGITAPPLHSVTEVEIAEAVRTGPANMPVFGHFQVTKSQLADLIAYIKHGIQRPLTPGGFSLGGVGPVAEGFIGLFIGVGACTLLALWIGDRTERDDEEGEGHGGPAHDGPGHDGPTHEGDTEDDPAHRSEVGHG